MYLREYLKVPDIVDEKGLSKVAYMKVPYMVGEQVCYHLDKNRGFLFKVEKFLSKELIDTIRDQIDPPEKKDPQQTMYFDRDDDDD